ncbi:Hypothetical protein ABZS17I87_00947 [Kosakonia cowanii]
MFNIEKDDPREAPESGDKKPQPVKNSYKVASAAFFIAR